MTRCFNIRKFQVVGIRFSNDNRETESGRVLEGEKRGKNAWNVVCMGGMEGYG